MVRSGDLGGWQVLLCLTLVVAAELVLCDIVGTPMPCTYKDAPSCTTASLYYRQAGSSQTQNDVATLFNVSNPADVHSDVDAQSGAKVFYVPVTCTCRQGSYLAQTSYVVQAGDTAGIAGISQVYFGSLACVSCNTDSLKPNQPITIYLLCGCPPAGWSNLLSYSVKANDTLSIVTNEFQSSLALVQKLSNIVNPNMIDVGEALFIPRNSIATNSSGNGGPSDPGSSPGSPSTPASSSSKKSSTNLGMVLGIVAAALIVLVALLVGACCLRWRILLHFSGDREYGIQRVTPPAGSQDISYSLGSSRGSLPSKGSQSGLSFSNWRNCVGQYSQNRGSGNNAVKGNTALPREAMITVFDSEKPVVFNYEEILEATDNFNEAHKVGQGAFGLVFSAKLRNQKVAIKQMKDTKAKEFVAELKVLCKVHHTNLVELIGYSAGETSLFLVYEFVENGALSDRLHNAAANGHLPLPWSGRVQIALDAARGLEYIHDHTKAHYVHRDVKTSNILLDGLFRAKVSDFGLAKLVEQAGDAGGQTPTRVVGTFGYLAPEYVRDGQATSKSDVYAFGVVLMELITGDEAITRTKSNGGELNLQDRRSLVSRMSRALKDPTVEVVRGMVDPELGNSFPLDCVYKVAMLAKACVEEDPMIRPDIEAPCLFLSQTLLTSLEWEATLGGSSQIFSGLVQGR